jgi:hypothetical protein
VVFTSEEADTATIAAALERAIAEHLQGSVQAIHRPSTGCLRRPTPGEIVEGGRLGQPCGPGPHSRASQTQAAAAPPLPFSAEASSRIPLQG